MHDARGADPLAVDPLGADRLRAAVLAAWTANPDRFREDANTEADHVAGPYRDRAVVELAQNAADAAVRDAPPVPGAEEGSAGAPGGGRLLLRLVEDAAGARLVAANTGAPLDAAGLRALASLRASAKRDRSTASPPVAVGSAAAASVSPGAAAAPGATGRFGVGFAAVLALGDDVSVLGARGGVRFSADLTRDALAAASGELAAEVAARGGAVPVLRLPFPVAAASPGDPVPVGYDTAVVVVLRDAGAVAAVRDQLAAVDDTLLLALPALAEVVVELPGAPARRVADVADRWHLLARAGRFTPGDLAGLPPEEHERAARTGWSLTWALPRGTDGGTGGGALDGASGGVWDGAGVTGAAGRPLPGVLLAPTPTDEPLPWPAVLIASLPLEPSRRAPAPGPAAAVVLAAAADAWVELLEERALAGEDVLGLVPTGLPAGRVDAALHEGVHRALPGARLLHPIEGPEGAAPLRGRDAVVLDGPLADDAAALGALAPVVAGLVRAPRSASAVLRLAGVTRLALADLVEAVPAAPDPRVWLRWAGALAGPARDPLVREQLAVLPVLLADGRGVRGTRGLLLPPDGLAPDGVDQDGSAPDGPRPHDASTDGVGDDGVGATGRGVLAVLARVGAGVVHPALVREPAGRLLLELLGAVPVTARRLLEDPAVRAAVVEGPPDGLPDDDLLRDDLLLGDPDGDPDAGGPGAVGPLVGAVLALVAAAVADGELRPGDLPWLGDLELPAADGEPSAAAGLVLPGSVAAELLDPDEVAEVDPALLVRWGAEVLTAVGVADSLVVLRWHDVDPLDPPEDLLDLDGVEEWLADGPAGTGGGWPEVLPEVLAVRDLDLLRPGRVLDALLRCAGDRDLREALLNAPGGARGGPGPTAWWFADALGTAGRAAPGAPAGLRALLGVPDPSAAAGGSPDDRSSAGSGPGAGGGAGPGVLEGLGDDVARALGLVRSWGEVPAPAWQRLLDAAGTTAPPGPAELLELWAALATAAPAVRPPDRVHALGPTGPVVVDASAAVVLDAPMWQQVTGLGPQLAVPGELAVALADVLDLDLASERGAGAVVVGDGAPEPLPPELRAAAPTAPPAWRRHDRLELAVPGLGVVPVRWWVQDGAQGPVLHATGTDGLARAAAQVTGAWPRRRGLAALLAASAAERAALLAEDALG